MEEPDDKKTKHIEEVNKTELKANEGRYVLIDPGRRDIMYCTSTAEEKQIMTYTINDRLKCSRRFKGLRNGNKAGVIQESESTLSKTECNSVILQKYIAHL